MKVEGDCATVRFAGGGAEVSESDLETVVAASTEKACAGGW